MLALGRPILSNFVIMLSNPNVVRSLPGNSVIAYIIVKYKILVNAITSSVKVISEVFYETVRVYKKIVG